MVGRSGLLVERRDGAAMMKRHSDGIARLAARLLVACLCLLSSLPAGEAVLCIGADGHVAIELPHAPGHHGEDERTSTHHHEEGTEYADASPCASCAEGCTDHSLDRLFVLDGRPELANAALPAPLTGWLDPMDGQTPLPAPDCLPDQPPPDRTVVLLL